MHDLYFLGAVENLDEKLEELYDFVIFDPKWYDYRVVCIHCGAKQHGVWMKLFDRIKDMQNEEINNLIDCNLPNNLKLKDLICDADDFTYFLSDLIRSLKDNGFKIIGCELQGFPVGIAVEFEEVEYSIMIDSIDSSFQGEKIQGFDSLPGFRRCFIKCLHSTQAAVFERFYVRLSSLEYEHFIRFSLGNESYTLRIYLDLSYT